MCQPKPGPRCAGHVRTERTAVQTEINEVYERIESIAGHPGHDQEMQKLYDRKFELARKAQELDAAWDETEEGQAALAAEIAVLRERRAAAQDAYLAAEATVPANTVYVDDPRVDVDRLNAEPQVDPWTEEPVAVPKTFVRGPKPTEQAAADLRRATAELSSVQTRAWNARLRRQSKVEALACKKAGDEYGEDLALRHGPGTAWMKQSSISPMSRRKPGEEIHVSPALAVQVVQEDSYDEESYSGEGYRVAMGSVVVEQPVTSPGPMRHVVGDHPLAQGGPLIVQEGHGGEVTAYGETANPKKWSPEEINSAAASYGPELHEGTVKDLLPPGVADSDPTITWNAPTIVRDHTGKPILMRTTATWEASARHEGRRRY